MRRYPNGTRVIVALSFALSLIAFGINLAHSGMPREYAVPSVVLGLLAYVTRFEPVRSARHQSSSALSSVFFFSAALLLPVTWAIAICLATWGISFALERFASSPGSWVEPASRVAQSVASVQAAATVFAFSGVSYGDWKYFPWMVLAAAAFSLAQNAYAALLSRVPGGSPFTPERPTAESMLTDLFELLLGIAIVLLWKTSPQLFAFFGALLVWKNRSLRGIDLIREATLDAKTGLYNYRYFERQLTAEVRRSVLLARPLSLVFLDLDYLRRINNAHGHQAGDQVIQKVAEIIQKQAVGQAVAARFGGEEFVLMLPGQDIEEAAYIAESIRQAIEDTTITLLSGQRINVTISGGVAAYTNDTGSPEALLKAADDALYKAKAAGRNRVSVAGVANASDLAPPLTSESVPAQGPAKQAASSAIANPQQKQDHFKNLPPAAKAMLVTLLLLAAPLSFWSVTLVRSEVDWLWLSIFCVVAGASQNLKVRIYVKDEAPRSMSISMAITMVVASYLGMREAVIANFAAALTQTARTSSRNTYKTALNLSMAVLSASAGSLPFEILVRGRLAGGLTGAGLLAIALGSLLYYVVNIGVVVLFTSLTRQMSPVIVWKKSMAWMTPHYLSLLVTGGFIGHFQAALGTAGTFTLIGLLILIHRTFDQQVQHMQTSVKALSDAHDTLAKAHVVEKQSKRALAEALSAIIDARDASVYGHSRQVARYSLAIAERVGITDPEVLEEIRMAALLHDVGKVAIPEALLHKPGKLTPEEYEVVKQHALIGERILDEMAPFKTVGVMVGRHHERWDGCRYPHRLAGNDIIIGARIVALADTLDCILSDRPYSKARTLTEALEEIQRHSSSQFDPTLVNVILALAREMPASYFSNSFRQEVGMIDSKQVAQATSNSAH